MTGTGTMLVPATHVGYHRAVPPTGQFPTLDRSVLEGMRRGEAAASGRFFDAFFDRIYGLAFRLTGDRTLAEDATQEVCYRIQRGARSLDPGRDPAPWVLAITLNTCRTVQRSSSARIARASHSIHDDRGLTRDYPHPGPDPQEMLLSQERERLVQEAILALDLPLRELILLHDYQGLDHREIAGILGLSHSAARKRYSRALAALAARLQEVMR